MKVRVICLKQDALYLFSLALAGCACGALVDLFESAYGYSESEEQRKRVKEFEQLERQFSDHDEEVQILDVQEDKKDQEEAFSHPFQVQPSTPNEGEAKPVKPSWGVRTRAPKHIVPEHVDSDVRKKQIGRKSHITWLTYPDLLKLQDATCLFPATSIKFCWMGVTKAMYSQDYVFQPSSKARARKNFQVLMCALCTKEC